MYSIKVRRAPQASYAAVAAGAAPTAAAAGASGSGRPSPSASQPATPTRVAAVAVAAEDLDEVSFSTGNPRVEHMVGRVHLYRHLPPSGAKLKQAAGVAAQLTLQQQQGDTLSSEIEPVTGASGAEVDFDLPVSCPAGARWWVLLQCARRPPMTAAGLKL